jgi:hypothetical protein
MQINHIILILFFAITSCNSKSTIKDHTNSKNKFQEYIRVLPNKHLPIEFKCGLPSGLGSSNLSVTDLEIYKAYFPIDHQAVFGLINQRNQYKAIIYGKVGDDIYPTLVTYDSLGNKIDSLTLILNSCGGADDSQIPYTVAKIDTDFKISISDTLSYIHFPNDGEVYIIDSIRVKFNQYHVNEKGKIIKSR